MVGAINAELARRPGEYNLDAFIVRIVRQVDDVMPPHEEFRACAKVLPWGAVWESDLDRLARGLIKSKYRLVMPAAVVQTLSAPPFTAFSLTEDEIIPFATGVRFSACLAAT